MNTNSMADFPSIAFQSSLTTEAILFGVFGFLYSVFGTYATNPNRPRIVHMLRRVCKGLALFIVGNGALNICSLVFMGVYSNDISGWPNTILAWGFGAIIAAIAIFSFIWAFWFMNN